MKKKIICLLLAVLLAAGLAGCGSESANQIIGVWRAEIYLVEGTEMKLSEFDENPDIYLEFSETEVVLTSYGSSPVTAKWTRDKETITITGTSGNSFTYKFENDVITETLESGAKLTYYKQVPAGEIVPGNWEMCSIKTSTGLMLNASGKDGSIVFTDKKAKATFGSSVTEYDWEVAQFNRINFNYAGRTVFEAEIEGDKILLTAPELEAVYYFEKTN